MKNFLENKATIKKDLTEVFLILNICNLFLILATILGLLFLPENLYNIGGSLISIIYCIIIGSILVIKKRKEIFSTNLYSEKMSTTRFFGAWTCLYLFMVMFTIPAIIFETIVNQFGFSIYNDIGSANTFSYEIIEFLYVSLIGPICEELLFRGYVQKKFEKYNPYFAIMTSAIAFAFYHGNFSQIFQMIGVGLILGYISYKYSIKWAIFIHILHNTVFGELFGLLTDILEKNGEEYLLPIVNLSPFTFVIMCMTLGGIIYFYRFLLRKMKESPDGKITMPCKFSHLLYSLTSPLGILYLILETGMAIMILEKI